MSLVFAAPALPLHTAGPYVAAAYIVFVVVIVVYVAIMATRLKRTERELRTLQAELDALRPELVVLLGATAAQAVLGPKVRVTRDRGKPIPSSLAPYVFATVHPSSILRAPDEEARHRDMESFVTDLARVARLLG